MAGQEIAATVDVNLGLGGGGNGGESVTDILKDIRDSLGEQERVMSRSSFFGDAGGSSGGLLGGAGILSSTVLTGIASAAIGAVSGTVIGEWINQWRQNNTDEQLNAVGNGPNASMLADAQQQFDALNQSEQQIRGELFMEQQRLLAIREEIAGITEDDMITQEELVRLSELKAEAEMRVGEVTNTSVKALQAGVDINQELDAAMVGYLETTSDVNMLLEEGEGWLSMQTKQALSLANAMQGVANSVSAANAELSRSFSLISKVAKKTKSGRDRDQYTIKDDSTGRVYKGYEEDLSNIGGGKVVVAIATVKDAQGNPV